MHSKADRCAFHFPMPLEVKPVRSLANIVNYGGEDLGFQAMTAGQLETHSLIDEFLPTHDFSATYEICISAPRYVVYRTLLRSDFSRVRLLRLLMALRTGKWMPRNAEPKDLRQRLEGSGFFILAEVPDQEVVIGVAGRFWRPDGGRCTELTSEEFPRFSRPGYAKVAWNFRLQPTSAETTVLSTETRIKCFGQEALWKFRLYWSLVGPFSGLIRKAILRQVKSEAETHLIEGF